MKRIAIAAVLLVSLVGPARAGYDEGVEAYSRGDYATALKELRPLAEQGNVVAQFNLADMYKYGKGVPQDYVQAYMWWSVAGANGFEEANIHRDIVSEWMTPADISKAQALAREWMEKHGE